MKKNNNILKNKIKEFYIVNKLLISNIIEKFKDEEKSFTFIDEEIENLFLGLIFYGNIDFSKKETKGEMLLLHGGFISSINQLYNLHRTIIKIYNKKMKANLNFSDIKKNLNIDLFTDQNNKNDSLTMEDPFDNFIDLRNKIEHANDRNINEDSYFYGVLTEINEDNSFVNILYNCMYGSRDIYYTREGLESFISFYIDIVKEINNKMGDNNYDV